MCKIVGNHHESATILFILIGHMPSIHERTNKKGKAATSATFSFLFNCGFQPSPSAWAGHFSIKLKQLVVPKAVSAAVRMDTTTWMMFRQRSLFFINSRPSLSFGHLPRGGGEPSGL